MFKKESAVLTVEDEMHDAYETRARKGRKTQFVGCLTVITET